MLSVMPLRALAELAAAPERAALARVARGERDATRAFVRTHERAVFAVIGRIVGRGYAVAPSSAGTREIDDLAQETFLRAFRALGDFDPDGPATVRTWLLTIATRVALDACTRRQLRLAPLDAADRVATPGTPETERGRAELRGALQRAFEELPPDQRAAIVLTELEGLSVVEAAEALGAPAATVKTRCFRARERLKAALAGLRSDR